LSFCEDSIPSELKLQKNSSFPFNQPFQIVYGESMETGSLASYNKEDRRVTDSRNYHPCHVEVRTKSLYPPSNGIQKLTLAITL
jgi:hypothetical protein